MHSVPTHQATRQSPPTPIQALENLHHPATCRELKHWLATKTQPACVRGFRGQGFSVQHSPCSDVMHASCKICPATTTSQA